MFKIDTMKGHERMSTQDLLLAIGEAVKQGETDLAMELVPEKLGDLSLGGGELYIGSQMYGNSLPAGNWGKLFFLRQ